jgi:hypothetical protein
LVFTPLADRCGYAVEGETRFGRLFSGVAVPLEPGARRLANYVGDRRGTVFPSDAD